MKLTLKNSSQFSWQGLKGWSYDDLEGFDKLSAAYIEIAAGNSHGKTKNTKNDRLYYIVGGEGKFDISGNIVFVKKTDIIIIPKGIVYDFWAEPDMGLNLFLVHSPAFDQNYEENVA